MKTTELSDEQLEQELAARRKAKAVQKEKERKAYEANRDELVANMISKAQHISGILLDFKKECVHSMEEYYEILSNYGEIRGNSKDGYGLPHSSREMRLVRTRDTRPSWDERASKGEELIKQVLHEKAKRGSKYLPVILGFLERNASGDLENSKVMQLLQHRTIYDDPRWTEGLNLIEESFKVTLRGYAYKFQIIDEQGKWVSIPMNFSSI